jgi:hypothetical protein
VRSWISVCFAGAAPTEAFHTLNDVAKEYGYDVKKLIQHFQDIIDATEVPDLPD